MHFILICTFLKGFNFHILMNNVKIMGFHKIIPYMGKLWTIKPWVILTRLPKFSQKTHRKCMSFVEVLMHLLFCEYWFIFHEILKSRNLKIHLILENYKRWNFKNFGTLWCIYGNHSGDQLFNGKDPSRSSTGQIWSLDWPQKSFTALTFRIFFKKILHWTDVSFFSAGVCR